MNSLRKQFPREYRIWKAMRARCNAPCFKDSVYQRRKIKVCNRWDKQHKGWSLEKILTTPINQKI